MSVAVTSGNPADSNPPVAIARSESPEKLLARLDVLRIALIWLPRDEMRHPAAPHLIENYNRVRLAVLDLCPELTGTVPPAAAETGSAEPVLSHDELLDRTDRAQAVLRHAIRRRS